jgi:hypothetical protein
VQARDELEAVLGDREPVATTYEDACAVEEITDNPEDWTTGPQQLRCTYTGAVVALLPASTDAEAVGLAQEMLGERCEVPGRAVLVGRMGCVGGLWIAVVDADSPDEVISGGLNGANGHIVSAGDPFDGAQLTERARQEGAGFMLWMESMNGYLEEPIDPEKPAPQPERVRTCQEHSGDGNDCPGD